MKVLVTGAGALLGQGILRALKKSPLKPQLIAVDPSPLSAGLYWADEAGHVPMARDPSYMDAVEALLDQHRPDAVLLGTDVELHLFSRHRERLEATYNTHVVVASPEVVAIADDKYLTAQFFESKGFAAPRSVLPEEADTIIEELGFPLVVKPRVGARSYGVHKVRSREELDQAVEAVDGAVIQECVGTDDAEYTAGAVTFDGACHAAIVMRRDLRDGNTYRAYVEDFPELTATVRGWAEALNAHGPANFQFRIDGEGRAKVFEINGRFSGTTPLRHHAGFPEVDMVLRHVVLGEAIEQPTVEPMTFLRHWSETIVRPHELLR